jgi:hypothetical protein
MTTGGNGETFTDLYNTVLGPNAPYSCASHHAAGGQDSFLDLGDASAAYRSLVGHPAAGKACGNGKTADLLVQPGMPTSSLLLLKVWTTLPDGGAAPLPPCGAQMPANSDGNVRSANPLSAGDQAKVESWISGGALQN